MTSITEASTTTEIWIERVSAWRASGERAEAFSRQAGYAASMLRWWATKLKRDVAASAGGIRSGAVWQNFATA